MTRPLTLACLALAMLSLTPPSAIAQLYPPIFYPRYSAPRPFQPPSDPVHYPIEIGQYLTVGGASTSAPTIRGSYAIGAVGLYAQWNRYGFCPGLDLHSDSAFAWRVIEFTKGDFTGIPNSHPQTITTGIVLHLP